MGGSECQSMQKGAEEDHPVAKHGGRLPRDTQATRSGRFGIYSAGSCRRPSQPSGLESSVRCQRALLSTSAAYSADSREGGQREGYGNRDAREQLNGRSSMASQRDESTNPRRMGRGLNGNKYMDGNAERTNACVGDYLRSTRPIDALASRTIHKQPTVR